MGTETMKLHNKNGVVIHVNLSTVDSVRDLGKDAKTCFLNIGSIEVEVTGKAKAVAKQLEKARGHDVPVVPTVPVPTFDIGGEGSFARVENIADGPFDTETGLATGPGDEVPPPGDEPGMMGT